MSSSSISLLIELASSAEISLNSASNRLNLVVKSDSVRGAGPRRPGVDSPSMFIALALFMSMAGGIARIEYVDVCGDGAMGDG